MSVLQWLRETDPATFGEVPDAELAQFAADWDPKLVEADPEVGRLVKRTGLVAEQQQAAKAGARAETAAKVIGAVSDFGVFPVSPQGMGQAVRNIGGLARGLAVDTMHGKVLPKPGRLIPHLDATSAAVGAEPGQPLPGEEDLTVVQRGLADAAQALPTIAGAMAVTRLGVPPAAAFGSTMGGAALAETGDPQAALYAGTVGAMIPGVANIGRSMAAKVLNRAVSRGVISAEANTAQKVIEAGFAQGVVQALFEVTNLPMYAQMSPEDRREAIIRSLVANTAFLAMDVPLVVGPYRSVTQQQMQSRIRLGEFAGKEIDKVLRAPEFQAMLDTAVEQQALTPESMRPGARRSGPFPPDAPPPGDGGTPTPRPPPPSDVDPNVLADPIQLTDLRAQSPIDYAPWETEGGVPGRGERESGAVEFPYSAPENPREPQTAEQIVPDGRRVVAVEFPVDQITVDNKLVPQFKGDADPATGEVRGEELKGAKYERPSNPIVVWQLEDGRNVVVTGRHRLALAKRLGEKTIPATIVREADGFKRAEAITLDAEFNIRDGNGSVADYAQYFENTNITEAEARSRGLLDRVKGKAAWSLAKLASDDLKAFYRAGKITEAKAALVASLGAGEPGLQRVGMRYADRTEDFIANVMQAARSRRGSDPYEQTEIFPSDNNAWATMEANAAKAAKEIQAIRDQINAVRGAAKRPEVAKGMGVDVSDPQSVLRKLDELRHELARWGQWAIHPDLVARVEGKPAPEVPAPKPEAPAAKPEANEYAIALEAHTAASKIFTAAQRAYRERTIGDADFIAARKAFDVATEIYDAAFAKEAERVRVKPADPFKLEKVTPEQLKAEQETAEAKAKIASRWAAVEAKRAAPLTGDSSDVGQAKLFQTDVDLFSGPSAEAPKKPASKPKRERGQEVWVGDPPMHRRGTLAAEGPGEGWFVTTNLGEVLYPPNKIYDTEPRVRPLMEGGSRGGGGRAQAAGPAPSKGRPFYTPESKPRTAPAEAPQVLGGLDHVRPTAFPELVRLAQHLTGTWAKLKRYPGSLGAFYPQGRGAIKLNPILFKDPTQAAHTLAHEIGHLADYLPDRTMDRGNLLGRIASLREWLKQTISIDPRLGTAEALTPAERREIRRQAERRAGARPPKDEPGALAEWQQRVREEYAHLRDDAIDAAGLIAEPWIREELLGITRWWKPYDPAQLSESKLQYRESGVELYADAISVLFNAPAELQARAPQFWKTFFAYLDRKPEVKASFLELQTLLSEGPAGVARQRIAASKAGYDKAEEVFLHKIKEQQAARDTFRGFWKKFKLQHMDQGQALLDAAKHLRARGVDIPTTIEARLAWEEGLFGENANFRDLRRVFEQAVQPLEAAGADTHTLGAVMEYQREMGNRTAQQQLAEIRERLGNEKMALAEQAGELLSKIEAKGGGNEDIILRKIIAPVEAAGVSFDDVVTIRDLRAQQGSRAEIANPLGSQPEFAEQNLAQLLSDLGPERAQAVTGAAAKIRELFFERMQEAHRVGIVSETAMKVVEANRDSYAAFRAVEHVEPWVSPMVKRAHGHLGEIENPFVTTILKLTSLNYLIAQQKAKIAARDMYLKEFPESFAKAETYWDGRGFKARPPTEGMARLDVLENGRPVAYHVDPYIAAAFEKLPTSQMNVAMATLDVMFRRGVYPLIIKWNPGFQYVLNPMRDYKRSQRNLGTLYGVGRVEFLTRYLKAWKSAVQWSKGKPDQTLDAMMEAAAIGTPIDTFSNLDRTDPLGEIMRRYRLLPQHSSGPAKRVLEMAIKPAVAVLNHIEKAGVIREALPKVASWNALMARGVSPREAGWAVRNYTGTPNYRIKGTFGHITNTLIPFSNIFVQGYRSDLSLAMQPKTAGGWWFRWAVGDGSRAVVQGLAAAGLMGAALKELYDGVSEYDKTNYLVVPVGWLPGGDTGRKSVYVRIPRDETSRLLSSVTYKALRAMFEPEQARRFPTETFAVGAGMVPSPSPILDVVSAWSDYASGLNPVDSWRNQPIVPRTEFEAGVKHSLGPMITWTAGALGALNLVRYDPKSDHTWELITSATPGLNRVVKVSDAGHRAKQYEEMDDERRTAAINKLAWAPEVRSALNEYYRLQRLGLERTDRQSNRFVELIAWKAVYDAYDAGVEAALHVNDKEGAAAQRRRLAEVTKGDMQRWEQNRPSGRPQPPWTIPVPAQPSR